MTTQSSTEGAQRSTERLFSVLCFCSYTVFHRGAQRSTEILPYKLNTIPITTYRNAA